MPDPGQLIRSAVCASVGSGGLPAMREAFIADALASAEAIADTGMIPATSMAMAPNRIQLDKNKTAWQEFRDHLSAHPATGAAHTKRSAGKKTLAYLSRRAKQQPGAGFDFSRG